MKNLFVIGLLVLLAMACTKQAEQELVQASQEHPAHVVTAVEEHLENSVAEKFLPTLVYDEGDYVIYMDISHLDQQELSSKEMINFLQDLLGSKFQVLDNSQRAKNSGCTAITPCLDLCTENGVRPRKYPNDCISAHPGSSCTFWYWYC